MMRGDLSSVETTQYGYTVIRNYQPDYDKQVEALMLVLTIEGDDHVERCNDQSCDKACLIR